MSQFKAWELRWCVGPRRSRAEEEHLLHYVWLELTSFLFRAAGAAGWPLVGTECRHGRLYLWRDSPAGVVWGSPDAAGPPWPEAGEVLTWTRGGGRHTCWGEECSFTEVVFLSQSSWRLLAVLQCPVTDDQQSAVDDGRHRCSCNLVKYTFYVVQKTLIITFTLGYSVLFNLKYVYFFFSGSLNISSLLFLCSFSITHSGVAPEIHGVFSWTWQEP